MIRSILCVLLLLACSSGPKPPYADMDFDSCAKRYDALLDMRDGITPPLGELSEALAQCSRELRNADRALTVCSVRLKDAEEADHD